MTNINVPISPGELLDKISILTIKSERISDANKRENVQLELNALTQIQTAHFDLSGELGALYLQLKKINEALWDIEDDIRDCERDSDFSDTFIELARSVYITNDKRAAVKKEINLLLGSELVEEKSYSNYA